MSSTKDYAGRIETMHKMGEASRIVGLVSLIISFIPGLNIAIAASGGQVALALGIISLSIKSYSAKKLGYTDLEIIEIKSKYSKSGIIFGALSIGLTFVMHFIYIITLWAIMMAVGLAGAAGSQLFDNFF